MFSIKTLPEFSEWLANVKDGMTLRRLARRLEKAQLGNLGDVKPVGDGVWEMREFFGPGWRMYYIMQGQTIVVMLGVATRPLSKPIFLPLSSCRKSFEGA